MIQLKVLKLVGGKKFRKMVVCGYVKRAETDWLAEMFQLKVLELVGWRTWSKMIFYGYAKRAETD